MNKLYLVELIEYSYDGYAESIDQEQPEVLGLYTTKEEYKARVELEISNYKLVSKTNLEITRDDELVEGCMDVVDIVSKDARVTIIVTELTIGSSKKLVDYNRINYYFDYEKTTDVEVINLGIGTVN
ncbi:hypothetical protein [Clostridium gasigenes]|uniref:hypothetical protein n=1 Tax=Clostridium gasigenes TaxID=94869 RepID=UPI00143862DE|nr:hypothetical protein [Clostridium gasigenes]MBU3105598.1 hypothetical protein [Clostridium gasigenes]MBU3136074.1 hypothetical protein [Clostridium gasigenes]NKF06851.1 hypothetical protein [Clostridium gasigenes]QSW19880.1 hypothetical protein J1C67_01370 [Clostridium gasigenes]